MGHYRIIRRLATGGMAEVYLGKLVGAGGFEKPVAIKRMLPSLAADPASAAAFLAEARLCVHLVHPNVVQVLDLGTTAGAPYLVMELVDGEDLRKILNVASQAGAPLQPPEVIHVVACVAEALAYADETAGPNGQPLHVVHRDVNPSNVMISMAGEVKLADFGVAKAADGRQSTQGNLLKGKLGYLAPELLSGAPAQHASDIFLTGVLLFELLAGRPLFATGSNAGRTLAMIAAHDENQLDLPAGAPEELLPILRRALARDPAMRYRHASHFASDLRTILEDRRWRVGREQLAARMASLFPGRAKLDQDLSGGVPLQDDRSTQQPPPPPPQQRPRAEDFGVAPRSQRRRLGEMLVEAGLITGVQLQTLLARQRQEGGKLGEWAVSLEYAPARAVLQVLAKQLGVPFITDEKLLEARPSAEMIANFPQEIALRLLALPVSERDGTAFVAMTDPANLEKLDMIRFRLGMKVRPIVCTEFGLRRAIARVFGGRGDELKWRQLDASDPLSLLSTRVIDFEAIQRRTDAETMIARVPTMPPAAPAAGTTTLPGMITPAPGAVPAGTPVTPGGAVMPQGAVTAPPGYLLAYVPTGIGPDGQPIYVAVPVPQPVPGAATPQAVVPGMMPVAPAAQPAAQPAAPAPRNDLRANASREIDFGDEDFGEELELDDSKR
ncbi:protein kinase domain-containing protein [Vulgatibacter sp.]|uniref:protein kinase domain-containing protein n=1 Tax=Vulgatibacter sp. TaxID=1971226 RepID=UPI003561858A